MTRKCKELFPTLSNKLIRDSEYRVSHSLEQAPRYELQL